MPIMFLASFDKEMLKKPELDPMSRIFLSTIYFFKFKNLILSSVDLMPNIPSDS